MPHHVDSSIAKSKKDRSDRLQNLCLRIIDAAVGLYIADYDQTLERSVDIDVCYLKHASKLAQNAKHPLHKYFSSTNTTSHTRH